MSGRERGSIEVRAMLSDADRARRLRGLLGAMVVCDLLVIAIVVVGLAVEWPVWLVALVALFPLAIGAFAVRLMLVLRGRGGGPGTA